MEKLKWEVIHEGDEEDGSPTMWRARISHPNARFLWINGKEKLYVVELDCFGQLVELKRCKSLASAKRWSAGYAKRRAMKDDANKEETN